MKIKAISDHIVAVNGDFGDQVTESGLLIKSTAGKNEGIVPRWFEVHSVGPSNNLPVTPGQWVLVENGRWSESFKHDGVEYWRLDPQGCLAVQDEKPGFNINFNNSTAFDGVYRNPLDK